MIKPTTTGQPRGAGADGDADAGETPETGRLPALDVPAGWASGLYNSYGRCAVESPEAKNLPHRVPPEKLLPLTPVHTNPWPDVAASIGGRSHTSSSSELPRETAGIHKTAVACDFSGG